MTGLLNELSTRIANRWLSALLLPGLLYTTATVCGYLLGWRHALDPGHLQTRVEQTATALSGRPTSMIMAVLAFGLAATAAGQATRTLATGVHRVHVARTPRWWLLRRRGKARTTSTGHRPRPPARYLPRCATPIGDRFRLIGERIDVQYGLDATLAWPRLWLILPDPARTAVQTAHDQYRAATTLTAWGLLYLALGLIWPPALAAGAAATSVGYRRTLNAAATLSDLIEAAIDTHQPQLAAIAGITLPHGRITRTDGARINDILNKRA